MLRCLMAVLALSAGGAVLGQSVDVGLVNMVSGAVTFVPASGAPARDVQAFMKVRDGDRVDVAGGGEVRVVFFDAARQERWVGPASFRAGRLGTEPVSGKPAEVSPLPAGVPQRIARVPALMQIAKLGGIQVRGATGPAQSASLEQQPAVAEARATYERMRREAAADDITPELFLFSALHEFHLYNDMKTVAGEMLRRQPGNENVKALAAWVQTRTAR